MGWEVCLPKRAITTLLLGLAPVKAGAAGLPRCRSGHETCRDPGRRSDRPANQTSLSGFELNAHTRRHCVGVGASGSSVQLGVRCTVKRCETYMA